MKILACNGRVKWETIVLDARRFSALNDFSSSNFTDSVDLSTGYAATRMTKRKVVEDSDGEDECDVASPTNANFVKDALELDHSSPLRTTSRSTIPSTGSTGQFA